jgi:hypothetical protein
MSEVDARPAALAFTVARLLPDRRRDACGTLRRMKHAQILDKLAARGMPEAIEDDIARLMRSALITARRDPRGAEAAVPAEVLPPLLARWGCVLNDEGEHTTALYRDKVAVALATCLHKVGLVDAALTERAVKAIDALNKAVALSDAFERQSPDMKALLCSPATLASRAPTMRETLTFCRAQDLLAIRVGGQYVAAYVHKVGGFNEYPLIELYAPVFDALPKPADLQQAHAAHRAGHPEHFMAYGLRHLPDPAAQPDASHLKPMFAGGVCADVFMVMAAAANWVQNGDMLDPRHQKK